MCHSAAICKYIGAFDLGGICRLGSDIRIGYTPYYKILQIAQKCICEKCDDRQHPSSRAGAILYIIMVILCIRQLTTYN